MLDHIRRILLVVVIFMSAGWLYKQWQARTGGEGIFDFIETSGKAADKSEKYTAPTGAKLNAGDVPGLSKLSDESAKLAGAVLPAVVSIDTATINRVPVRDIFGFLRGYRTGVAPGLGSGVIVSKEGHVITNYHVIKGASQIKITTNDRKSYKTEIVGMDTQLDIAVLKIVGGEGNFTALNFANSDDARPGQWVYAVGNPFGFTGTVTQGIISATQRKFSDTANALLQTDTVINPGNSGGPLVNVLGEILGINVAIYTAGQTNQSWQGVGLAVPANDVKEAFQAIMQRGAPVLGFLGIQVNPEPVGVDSALGTTLGAMIETVTPNSPAATAGVKEGDVIMQFGNRRFASVDELMLMIARAKPGEEIPMVLVRNGSILKLTARIGPRPSNS
ncbi:MAG: S1C family serine protease [Verrucomicrobium sp.]|nr:trypsin-like peptidase domain-containing protein [Verrucomicrobium sp.]